jgi:hypothetical protein
VTICEVGGRGAGRLLVGAGTGAAPCGDIEGRIAGSEMARMWIWIVFGKLGKMELGLIIC